MQEQGTKTLQMYLDRNGYTQSIKKYADKYADRWPNTHYPIKDAITSAHPLAECMKAAFPLQQCMLCKQGVKHVPRYIFVS